jgi:cytochrome oxidase Cu insertion factor (SCO1/SenC/PrrC family)
MKLSISPRIALLVIAAMFLLPLTLAWLMYSGSVDYQPGSTRNLGTLIEPPLAIDWGKAITADTGRPLAESPGALPDSLLEHWVILHPIPAKCEVACRKRVTALRQIHLATGRHQKRLRLVLLLDDFSTVETADLLLSIYDKYTLIRDPGGNLRATLATAGTGARSQPDSANGTPVQAGEADGIYLIDPLGNIMMYYAANADPNHIRQDLKRLIQ